ncbi:MAG TPA: hypothetical protein VK181_09615, partial [Rhizobium sp.]|nr:hypothetical protein [Rhizobium sp.]
MFGVWIGFRAAESRRSFELLADTLAVFLITLVPFAIAGAILGSDRLPAVLQTVELYAEFGGGTRARDLSAFAGPTASAGVMAGIAMGGFFLSLGRVLSGDRRGHVLNLAGLVAAMLLLVFCGKRGPLILSIAFGLLMMMAVKRAKRGALIVLIVAGTAMIGVKAVDRMRTGAGYESSYGEHAGDLDIENRFYNIFWGTVTAWAEAAPVGSYLGNWGAEWRAFNGLKGVVVETGAALLIAETGILGALIFPFVIGICVISAYRASKSIHARPIVLCLLCFEVAVAAQFYFQVYGIMMGGGFTPLLFWTSFGIAYSAIQGSAPSPRLRCA